MFDKISNRQTKILENLNKQKSDENLKQFLSNIFNLQVKVWKCLVHSKIFDKRNKDLKDTFDYMKYMLNKIEDLFKTTSKTIDLMLKEVDETDYYKQSIYVELINKLTINSTESKRKLKNSIYDLGKQNSFLGEDLFEIEEVLSKLYLKFIDSFDNFEKTLAEN